MSKKRLKIMDWYVHQGMQYEFSKLDHDFHISGIRKSKSKWNALHRPLHDNITLTTDMIANKIKFDVVIIRSPIDSRRYISFIKNGAVPIAIMQTTNGFRLPKECKHVIWNSVDVMNACKDMYPGKSHKYIVHGYDPNEFRPTGLEKNGRVLTVANVFKGRAKIMGYPLWLSVRRKMKNLDVIGHGNLDMYRTDRQAKSLDDLIASYNKYSLYFNTTQSSAMPRTRAEAMMCGCPIVSTNNFDIGRYIVNGKSGFLSNDSGELIRIMRRLLKEPKRAEDFGKAAREAAIKHFHIDDYLSRWEHVLGSL